jgi:DNA topoisomerase-3
MQDKQPIAETLQIEARICDKLVLWLDCDREGENISFEVVTTCQEANRNLRVHTGTIKRARFSEFTPRAIV